MHHTKSVAVSPVVYAKLCVWWIVIVSFGLSSLTTAFAPLLVSPTTPAPHRHVSRYRMATEDERPQAASAAANVLGTSLACCCDNVRASGIGTGFYRNGYCSTGEADVGRHTVCVRVTDKFLEYSRAVGNDLSTPVPQYHFPGLRDGDLWCLCAERWVQAYQAGNAPKLFLQATHEKTLNYVDFAVLREYALDGDEADLALRQLNEQRERLKKML